MDYDALQQDILRAKLPQGKRPRANLTAAQRAAIRQRVNPIRHPIVRKPVIPARDQMIQYWHPDRIGAISAPSWFARDLEQLHPDLRCVMSPVHQRWIIWQRKPENRNPITQGWSYKFDFDPDKLGPLPLARLYEASARKWGSGAKYIEAVQREMARDEAARVKAGEDERAAEARDTYRTFVRPHVMMNDATRKK